MEGDKSTNYNDEYYKNVKLVGFVKTDCETLPGYKNDAFQWSSSDNLSNYPPVYHNENNLVPSKYHHIHKKKLRVSCRFGQISHFNNIISILTNLFSNFKTGYTLYMSKK